MVAFINQYNDNAGVTALTDSTGGTVSNTLNDTTTSVKDDLAALAGKINEIIVVLNAARITGV